MKSLTQIPLVSSPPRQQRRRCGWSTAGNPHHPTPTHLSFALSAASSSLSASASPEKPVVVVGSANADIYVEIDRLPLEGETISARGGQTLAGGKGANQACCGGRLDYPTYFVGQVGDDAHGRLIEDALRSGGVLLDRLARVPSAPTGHAVVMLQPDGQNTIIIIGGANMNFWPEDLRDEDLDVVRRAGVVLLQREIPDRVNIQIAQAAKNAGVPIILDAGGMESPIPDELLKLVDFFSPNETELARLTGLPTESLEQIVHAVEKIHDKGVNKILLKLGAKGSVLFVKGQDPIMQPIIPASVVLDTTGAGDTFTAAFAVALVESKTMKECLEFAGIKNKGLSFHASNTFLYSSSVTNSAARTAAAAASLCVQAKGAIPSIPNRAAVLELLQSFQADATTK